MKKIILAVLLGLTVLSAQDAAGKYKLSGVDVLYTYIARENVTLTVTDAYGLAITQTVAEIPVGAPFTTQPMQLTDAALPLVGINLNITINEDGSGSLAEGSFYPDINTITGENGACVTIQQVLPISDNFTYTSSATFMSDNSLTHPGVNVLGVPGISGNAGKQLGGFGLSGSLTFEDFSIVPLNPEICPPSAYDGDGNVSDNTNCIPFTVGDLDEDGTVQVYPATNALGISEYIPGGSPLTGVSGGYFLKEGLHDESLFTPQLTGNTDPDFILEWHGIDGKDSGLGYGDNDEVDEDGDGTWFDRQLGIPSVTATYMNPSCGFNLPIYGDVTEAFTALGLASCIDNVDVASSAYLMDPSGSLATWGNFLTANAAAYAASAATLTNLTTDPVGIMAACGSTGEPTDATAATCLATAGTDATAQSACVATCATAAVAVHIAGDATLSLLLVDDSAVDFDSTATTGRLTMNFDIPCVPVIEAREVIAEFIELGDNSGCMESNACNYDPSATTSGYACIYGSNDVLDSTTGSPTGNKTPCYAEGECDYSCDIYLASEQFVMIDEYSLDSIYPNPFNPNTTIKFTMPVADIVSLKVYDINGRELASLINEYLLAGTHIVNWNASNYPSGVYIVKMNSGMFNKTQKIILMK